MTDSDTAQDTANNAPNTATEGAAPADNATTPSSSSSQEVPTDSTSTQQQRQVVTSSNGGITIHLNVGGSSDPRGRRELRRRHIVTADPQTSTAPNNRLTAVNTSTRRTNNSSNNIVRVSHGPGIRIVTNGTGRPPLPRSMQQHVPRVPVPPLLPMPLPYATSDASNNTSDQESNQEGNDYKCLICFEFLQDPASCGKCTSRFCFACITRVAEMTPQPKCPTCRCEFASQDILRDVSLQEKMREAATVTCHFEGCKTQLALSHVATHEQTCPFLPLKCRYATFGCDWKGVRKDLQEHESKCSLMQVSALVEDHRQVKADHEHALGHLQTRVAASNAMMELHASVLRRLHKRLYHPGDFLDFIYTLTCTPARFLYTKDIWRSFYSCKNDRGVVCNALAFLPTVLLVIRIKATGFRQLLQLDALIQHAGSAMEDGLEVLILSLLIALLGFLMLACFTIDGRSSVEWKPNMLRGWRTRPTVRDACAIASWALYLAAMEFDGGGLKASLVWLLVCTCSTYFTSLVITMLEIPSSNPSNVFTAGRALPVVVFGMRYGFVSSLMGIVPCLDAMLFQQVLRKYKPERMAALVIQDDCFLTEINTNVLFGYAGFRLTVKIAEFQMLPTESLGAFIWLLVVNHVVTRMAVLGATVGTYVMTSGKHGLLPNQAGVRVECSTAGTVAFATWVTLLLSIVIAY